MCAVVICVLQSYACCSHLCVAVARVLRSHVCHGFSHKCSSVISVLQSHVCCSHLCVAVICVLQSYVCCSHMCVATVCCSHTQASICVAITCVLPCCSHTWGPHFGPKEERQMKVTRQTTRRDISDKQRVARVNKVTPVSLGYPLSVSNKSSTPKQRKQHCKLSFDLCDSSSKSLRQRKQQTEKQRKKPTISFR